MQYHEAVSSYKQARDFAVKYLGIEDTISKNLDKTYEKAKEEIEVKIAKAKLQEEKLQRGRQQKRAISANQKENYLKSHTYGKQKRNTSSTKYLVGKNTVMSPTAQHSGAQGMVMSPNASSQRGGIEFPGIEQMDLT